MGTRSVSYTHLDVYKRQELKSHLEDLRDTTKYMNLIEQRNKEIAKERAKREQEEELSLIHIFRHTFPSACSVLREMFAMRQSWDM